MPTRSSPSRSASSACSTTASCRSASGTGKTPNRAPTSVAGGLDHPPYRRRDVPGGQQEEEAAHDRARLVLAQRPLARDGWRDDVRDLRAPAREARVAEVLLGGHGPLLPGTGR